MKKIYTTLPFSILFFLLPTLTWAQIPGIEAQNWYFGTGVDGLRFDSLGNVQKLNNKVSGMGFEGMIVANHPTTGELLFYSDGERVIDKNHNIIANGTGLNGHYSGAQDVQCLPVPCRPNQYYLLTNGAWDSESGNLYYSIVDFSDTLFPNGVVKNKNTLISNINYSQANKLIPKLGTSDYWWIGHEWASNKYHVIRITSTGFTYSHVFTAPTSLYPYAMNFSSVNQKLVISGSVGPILFDFNPQNGQISNEVRIVNASSWSRLGAFSPDGTKLYFGLSDGKFWQYDFTTSILTNMNICCDAHDAKVAPNGKMYYIHTVYSSKPLGVINKPNLSAINNACEAENLDMVFTGEVRRFPELVTIPYAFTELTKTINYCQKTAKITVTHNIQTDSITYQWYFNNSLIPNQTSSSIVATQSGDYEVRISDYHNCTSSPIVYKKKTNFVVPAESVTISGVAQNISCFGLSNGRILPTITNGNLPYRYRWSNGDTTAALTNLTVGTYNLTVTDAQACATTQTFTLTEPTKLTQTLLKLDATAVNKSDGLIAITAAGGTPPYAVVLKKDTTTLSLTGGIPPQYIYANLAKGRYFYTVTDANGCTKSDSCIINDPLCGATVSLSDDTTICEGGRVKLRFSVTGVSDFLINYSDGSTLFQTAVKEVTVTPSRTTTYKLLSLTSGSCNVQVSGSAKIRVNSRPQMTDTYYSMTGTSRSLLINCTEILKKKMTNPPLVQIYLPKLPANSGTISDVGNQSVLFNVPDGIGKKSIEIPLRVCNSFCPNLCDSSRLIVDVDIPDIVFDIAVPKVFSTDNSTTLPSLEIGGLEWFPVNEMAIFDRWGIPVFGPVVYKNKKNKQAWDGTKNGQELPTGVYYYYIKYIENNVLKTKSGAIYLIGKQ